MSEVHADDTASALRAIAPDFIRLRTTAVIPNTPLFDLEAAGDFVACTELELVTEIRRFLDGLGDLQTRLESDHMLNLLMELRGDLPDRREALIAICDRFIGLPGPDRWRFVLARRMGWMGRLADFLKPGVSEEIAQRLQLPEQDEALEAMSADLRKRMV